MPDIVVQSLGFKIYHAETFFKILKPFTNSHMIIIDFKEENKMKIRGIINNKIRSQFFSGRLFPELPARAVVLRTRLAGGERTVTWQLGCAFQHSDLNRVC